MLTSRPVSSTRGGLGKEFRLWRLELSTCFLLTVCFPIPSPHSHQLPENAMLVSGPGQRLAHTGCPNNYRCLHKRRSGRWLEPCRQQRRGCGEIFKKQVGRGRMTGKGRAVGGGPGQEGDRRISQEEGDHGCLMPPKRAKIRTKGRERYWGTRSGWELVGQGYWLPPCSHVCLVLGQGLAASNLPGPSVSR